MKPIFSEIAVILLELNHDNRDPLLILWHENMPIVFHVVWDANKLHVKTCCEVPAHRRKQINHKLYVQMKAMFDFFFTLCILK